MPSSTVTRPAFDELSADLRWKLAERRARQDWAITALCSAISAALLIPVAAPGVNRAIDGAIAKVRGVAQRVDRVTDAIAPDYNDPVEQGEKIAGYTVTSGYGWRDTTNLPAGASSDHRGVDLATPIGKPIYALGRPGTKVQVRCWSDAGGGGLVAEIVPESLPSLRFQALHLSECKTGLWDAGKVIGRTGDTGIGAPHLDWRQRDKATSAHQHPQKGYLLWALTGSKPRSVLGQQLKDDIKESEGLELTAYLDPVGVPTIGYGTTVYPNGRKVQLGDNITLEQAEQYLQHDIDLARAAVADAITQPLKQNEVDALTSFTYNVGAAALKGSTLADKLNAGDKAGAAAEFNRWVHGDGIVLPGLVTRRAEEKALFLE